MRQDHSAYTRRGRNCRLSRCPQCYSRELRIYPRYGKLYLTITQNFVQPFRKKYRRQIKNVQNYIYAVDADGKEFTIFTPLAPYETPIAVDAICEQFNRAIAEGEVDPLILIPIFIHDFLCIHPFSDGNGRMGRLLTTLLLYRCGYFVGRYISLEAKIAKSKDLYYDALSTAQVGWHEGKDDPSAFVKYILGTIISAYRDFEDRMEIVSEKLPALEMVRKAVRSQIGKITKTQVLALCPSLSASSVEVALKKLVKSGELNKRGAGRSTFYVRTD